MRFCDRFISPCTCVSYTKRDEKFLFGNNTGQSMRGRGLNSIVNAFRYLYLFSISIPRLVSIQSKLSSAG